MGHVRLGRLPHRLKWSAVVALLGETPTDGAVVAKATIEAAEQHLISLRDDPALNYCFWLLTRITWAARSDGFLSELNALGFSLGVDTPTLAFVAAVTERVRTQAMQNPESGATAEMASLALRRALTETVGQQGPSLFGTTLSDLQAAFRTYSTREHFAQLSQRFFGDFLARTLRSYVDREIPNLVGASPGLRTVGDSREAIEAIDRHARETAFILRDFAGGWYSKNQWESRGSITPEQTKAFTAHALRKMRSELKRAAAE